VSSLVRRPANAPNVLLHAGRLLIFAERPARSVALKRAADLAIAVPLALLSLPLLAIAALAVRLTSPGPAIFGQMRASSRVRRRPGEPLPTVEIYPFRCFKLRTMCAHADEMIHMKHIRTFVRGEVGSAGTNGFKVPEDARITPVGWMLRRTSIDELPQLFNVLLGDMSLVGPRPVPLYEIDEYPREALERLLVKPGLTGLWQVEARSMASFEEMVELDIRYARSGSLWRDFKLLARTLPCVLTRRGAA
jgi:lipopolysaccharide/colanic/teichoic acid biosynthesis glycosyltransferase